jgi:hypothetical protein
MAAEVRQRKPLEKSAGGDGANGAASPSASSTQDAKAKAAAKDSSAIQDDSDDPWDNWSWTSPSTWPLSLKFSPIFIALMGLFTSIYYNHFLALPDLDLSSQETCVATFNYTIYINSVRHQVEQLSAKSWEIGTAVQAILELTDREKTVWAQDTAFPDGKVPSQGFKLDPPLFWSYQKINSSGETLHEDEFSVSDPAALGVAAVMIGQRWPQYLDAAERQLEVLRKAPKYTNGAISHRWEVKELWSDAISMFPPFLAYYAVQKGELDLMRMAYRQIMLYRDVLSVPRGNLMGLWRHIKGPSEMNDEGAWSTGNAWAAYGMARTRATISAWNASREILGNEIEKLDDWVAEILDGAMRTDNDDSGLLRNYLGDEGWWGETSGTALLAATVYRMAVLRPERFGSEGYLRWAHQKRQAVFDRVDVDGFAGPAVDPYKHNSRDPVLRSPEGESFSIMLGAAWRDCVCTGICSAESIGERY